MFKKIMDKLRALNKNQILIGVAVLAILVTGVLISNKGKSADILAFFKPRMSNAAIAKKSIDYLNKSVLQNGQTATLGTVSEESGLVKIQIKIGTNTYDSYATKDGKLLFPEAFNIAAAPSSPSAAATTPDTTASITPANVAKVAKTSLEAFVVADCPFGIQEQRAIGAAIKAAPALAQYITVRYIGGINPDGKTINSMHGNEEAVANMAQICLRQEQPDKYWPSVLDYIKQSTGTASNGMPYGNMQASAGRAGADVAKMNACIANPTRGLAYAKADFALDTKYGVQGSPTLVLNGKEVSETPFGGRSAKGMGQLVCSSSTNPPSFCKDANFSVDQASTSFSLTYAGTGATGATANCAPATN